ncbi:alpha-glucosidase [Halobacillus aidingensis]|uniref:Alpha-amylase n=1 Tax=Halobacillus aidingensis TaxID=240303 RepID=A0A1H0IV62_HALAD|nr:alpha-glucosidase [Halobacillus aidingensis]SDO35130.1 alpha-glucosidase [Halobacillus aidingensis]
MEKQWWKEAVVYQVYPRSFKDADGDGTGDLLGVLSKLDYLQDLGIDVIWLSPVYQSPNDDNGYDISDYQKIMDEFGTMEDFDELLREVHNRGMKLIMDLVINHTSDEHRWFQESKSSKQNPYRDYYIWHPGKDGKEPNNWASIFEGSIWEYDEYTEEYYMHVFSKKQPDLNWENPEVRQELYKMVNWWLDKGIDGFRIDAISHIKKVPGYPDLPELDGQTFVPSHDGHRNREGIHVFLEELVKETFSQYDIMTVGEANGVTVEEADQWVGEKEGKFDMIFQFEHVGLWERSKEKVDIHELKEIFTKWQTSLNGKGWNALFLENHDLPRTVSILGDDGTYRVESSKCLATLYFFMQGTPFIYQGQEIGMTNVQFPSIEDYDDVAIKNFYKKETERGVPHEEVMSVIWRTGRDNSRTPMQWSAEDSAGFTTGTPWLKVNPNFREINVAAEQNNRDSIYYYYQKMIQIRNQEKALIYGDYTPFLEEHDQIFSYIRSGEEGKYMILANLSSERAFFNWPDEFAANQVLLCNYTGPLEHSLLQPFEARVYKIG